jgi:ABC-type phosphate/phosphonate transport system substrate-binding protein
VRKDLDDSGKEKLEAMFLTRQKDTEADRTLKDLGAQRFIETSGRDSDLLMSMRSMRELSA